MNDGTFERDCEANQLSDEYLKKLLEESLKERPGEAAYRSLPLDERINLIRRRFWSSAANLDNSDEDARHLCAEFWLDSMDEATFAAVAHFGMEDDFFGFVEANLPST